MSDPPHGSATSSPLGFDQAIARMRKWLLLADVELLRVVFATIVANRMTGDPLWLFIVAPSGGTKTELIQALASLDDTYLLSSLTPHTFVSGYIGEKDQSLLTALRSGTILLFKDFTSVLTMHREHRGEILGQLREIYDGRYRKPFGTGQVVDWSGKLGFIAGVTSIIDTHSSVSNVLGERFVQVRMRLPNEIRLAKKAMSDAGQEPQMRKELAETVKAYFNGLEVPAAEKVVTPKNIGDALARLAVFTVKARSGVIRHGYSRELVYVPDAEAPTRLAKQLWKLANGLARVRGAIHIGPPDLRTVLRVALDCITKDRRAAIGLLARTRKALPTMQVAERLRMPYATVERALEDLEGHGVVASTKGSARLWALSDWSHDRLRNHLSEVSGGSV